MLGSQLFKTGVYTQNPDCECNRDVTPVENAGSKISSPATSQRSAARSPTAEYDRGVWRCRLLAPLRSANRGNPNWGRPIAPSLALPTEFEMRVRQLQLTTETYTCSRVLRAWCEQNRNRLYVPEWLLEEWGITVDLTFGAVARP
jgi:hypothetical protein